MGEIEIIHTTIPLENYEMAVTELVNTLLRIDEKLFQDDIQKSLAKGGQ